MLSTDKVAKFYLFFQFGKFVNQYAIIKKIFNNNLVYTFGIICFFCIFYKYGYDLQNVNINSFILPLCGIIVISNFVEHKIDFLNYKGLLQYLGKNSLEIYLIHFFILTIIPKYIVDNFNIVYLQIFILLLLSSFCITISLVIASFIHYSTILDFILLGKGILLKKIFNKNQYKA